MLNKRLLKEAECERCYIPLNVFHSAVNPVFIILNAYLLALICDGIFIKSRSVADIRPYMLFILLNGVIKAVFNLLTDRCIKNCSENIKENIKANIFNRIVFSNPFKVKEQNKAEIINLLTEGTEKLTPYYSQYIPQLISSLSVPLIICASVAFVDRLSSLIMLVTYPLIPLFMVLVGYKTKELNEVQWDKLNILSSHFLDVLQGLRTLKVFGRSKIQEVKVFEVSERYRKSIIAVLKVSFLSALVLETVSSISTAVVAVNLGLRLVYGRIDFLTALFILLVTPDFYLPMRQLGVKYHSSQNGSIVMEKIEKLETILRDDTTQYQNSSVHEGNIQIEVDNLSFSHGVKENINNISFRISSGEKVALIGESGSGKSTLINILSGFLKVEDNKIFINGVDLNHAGTAYFHRLALVPQAPHIFNMSIEDNILLGSSIASETFQHICSITGVDSFAQTPENKYKTVIGDGEAIAISGGEKQKIALARALVRAADFIILDEPASALDSESEELVTKLIKEHLFNKTVLFSTHRLNTIMAADKILVLENGTLIEAGTHDELIKEHGKYYSLTRTMEEVP